MRLAIIAAIARNRVIGSGGQLPWRLPEDLKRFKQLTTGHAILMGRKTWESLGKPLPDRRNVVVSSRPVPGAEWYPSTGDALRALAGQERVFVIGGGTLYAQLLERADELYLTLLHREAEGDVLFPPYEHLIGSLFIERAREWKDGFDFVDYTRRAQ